MKKLHDDIIKGLETQGYKVQGGGDLFTILIKDGNVIKIFADDYENLTDLTVRYCYTTDEKVIAEKPPKRYFFSVVEECIMNSEYAGYRGGRIEVYDNESDSSYAIGEARFFLPEEFMEGFRNVFDFKDSDKPVFIDWDMEKWQKKN
jgi:hypothetical protein